jgi:uncharacterized lipoprotein YajG
VQKKHLILLIGLISVLVLIGCTKQNTAQQPSQVPEHGTTQTPIKVGKPTVVPKDKTIEQYVTDYFTAYKEGRYEDAYKLQPAENKAKQSLEQFISLRKGFPITSFTLIPTKIVGNQATIDVEYSIGQYGTWVSSWLFEKKNGQWIAVRYQSGSKQ